jgi:hypothetical protein
MSKLTGVSQAYSLPLYTFESTPSATLGTIAYDDAGNKYRYMLAGAVDLVADNLLQSPAIVANHQNMALAANAAVGATSISVTVGATAVTADQYRDGYVVINAGAGIGQRIDIKSHLANAGSATLVLNLKEPLRVALTTASSKVSLSTPYGGVIVNPTTATSTPAGVCTYAVTAANYFWGLVDGFGSVLSDVTIAAVGLGIIPSTTTAGCVTVATATGANIGYAVQAGVSAEARMARVSIS